MANTLDHGALMDRVYRLQRRFGFYDLTRKYYLIGRDPMLAGLRPPSGGKVLEIGCGTGRNLVKAAKLYPDAQFHGIDISSEMLAAAAGAISKAGLQGKVRLAHADAVSFEAHKSFGRSTDHAGYDRIFISYAVSMIPQWERAMAQAVCSLAPGGELHIADFGDMAQLPVWSRDALYTWLRWYHVTPRSDLFDVSADLAAAIGGESEQQCLHRGFSWVSIVRKPSAHCAESKVSPNLL